MGVGIVAYTAKTQNMQNRKEKIMRLCVFFRDFAVKQGGAYDGEKRSEA